MTVESLVLIKLNQTDVEIALTEYVRKYNPSVPQRSICEVTNTMPWQFTVAIKSEERS